MVRDNRAAMLSWKERAGIRLLQAAGISRIHIIGCSRSGTTMLQFAMSAFSGTIITNGETGIGSPYTRERLRLFGRYLLVPGQHHLITKRDVGWFHDSEVEILINRVLAENIGLVLLVRDPRDVLTSRHHNSGDDRPWVTPSHWHASIKAGDRILEELADYPHKIAIRYEDVVCAPAQTERKLEDVFGLTKRRGVTSIRNLRTNIDKIGYRISDEMLSAMHRLRDMDESVVQRWAKAHGEETFTIGDEAIQQDFYDFISKWNYMALSADASPKPVLNFTDATVNP